MRVRAFTQRRRRQKGIGGIQLFPFLAVLMCTMGSLILLMVILSRQARLQAAQTAARELAQQQSDAEREQKRVQWRIGQLQAAREKTEAELAETRLQLGHLEDHARRLRDELARLEKTLAELDRSGTGDRQRWSALEGELAKLRRQIAEAERQVADAEAAGSRRSYAIVPYEGPNQTRRRPLYLECRADTVVVQPENIVLLPEDFEGPMGPGNPLAVALRTAREYLLRQPGYDPQRDGEPYPLLLVRPEGIEMYYAARAGLQGWGSEFGYELIDQDWKLAFPPADAALAREIRTAVVTAREVQKERIALLRARRALRSRPTYRVAPDHGGVVLENGSPEENSSSGGFARHRPYLPADEGNENADSGGHGSSSRTTDAEFAAGINNPYAALNTPQAPGTYPGGTPPGSAFTPDRAGGSPGAEGGLPNSAGESSAGESNLPGGENPQTGGQNLSLARGGSQTAAQGTSSNNGGNVPSAAGCPLQGTGSSAPAVPDLVIGAPPPEKDPSASAPGSGTPLRPGQWEERPELPKDPEKLKKLESLAKKRGQDWGLLDRNRDAVPVTRPITVACRADQLVILPEPGAVGGKSITLGPRTETAIDRFVAALWERMQGWGIAGRNMYWRPVLKVQVAPGAENRFADLQALLEGSGFTVERK
ncbi:MAG: hypothetical protein JXB10_00190 [Pirellulales bacterium]|nr:hypothetical protein [Pirellulales bacterium]